MDEAMDVDATIATMPRGGPDASWLDRRLQTDVLEYTDRYDVRDDVKQTVVSALDRMGDRSGQHERNARLALASVADIPDPRILELGAGHGRLSEKIVELHPSATVTISDLDPTSVHNIATGTLGAHPRVSTQVVDAGAIGAGDDAYDLVVFAMAFHHLPPATAARTIAEATRVARRFLVIDLKRPHPLGAVFLPPMAALVAPAVLVRPSLRHVVHDGVISVLRAYSPSALVALGKAADPQMRIRPIPSRRRFGPGPTAVVFSRYDTAPAVGDSSGRSQ